MPKELCEICHKRPFSLLCDFQINSGIISSTNGFRGIPQTCDKKMCEGCAVNVWYDGDICPSHANEVYKTIISQSPSKKLGRNRL